MSHRNSKCYISLVLFQWCRNMWDIYCHRGVDLRIFTPLAAIEFPLLLAIVSYVFTPHLSFLPLFLSTLPMVERGDNPLLRNTYHLSGILFLWSPKVSFSRIMTQGLVCLLETSRSCTEFEVWGSFILPPTWCKNHLMF